MRWWTFEFHTMRGISWLAQDMLAFQEEHCSMEFVVYCSLILTRSSMYRLEVTHYLTITATLRTWYQGTTRSGCGPRTERIIAMPYSSVWAQGTCSTPPSPLARVHNIHQGLVLRLFVHAPYQITASLLYALSHFRLNALWFVHSHWSLFMRVREIVKSNH